MANARSANTFYIDTQHSGASDALDVANIRVTHVVVTATASNGRLVLQDYATSAVKADLRCATSGESAIFDFADNPLVFAGGIKAATLSNAIATCVLQEGRG